MPVSLFKSLSTCKPCQRYAIAVCAIILAAAVRVGFNPIFEDKQIFLFSNLAVILIAIYVGLGPALFGLALSLIINVPLFMSPWHSMRLTADDVISLVSYTLFAIVIITLAHRQREARELAHNNADEVLRLNGELELRVAKRTAELEEANTELAGMTYSIAHDMRQYLRGINVSAYTIVEDQRERLDGEGLESLESLGRNARQASALVEALLEFSRLGKNELRRKQVDLSSLCEAVGTRLQKSEKETTVHLDIEPGVSVSGDQQLLELALQNLIENAVKYRNKGTEPHIEFGSLQENGRNVYFVKDDGIGFDLKFVDHIFLPFERLHRSVDYPGTGIGLASVKKIIEKHGGQIWADSRPGAGATFFFTVGEPAEQGLAKAA